ncbi:MAG: phosphonate metabolism protein [Paenibacillus sp.]|jgi:alpha-D-ribose 1-methylphosphonate 5-triphosphate synthase subunit PhnH|nr:phosphonate metabolism protein [Paenibacillus sp.]
MPNVKDITFDRVHDTQFIFRQLLDVMARPGRIGSIASSAAQLELLDAGQKTAAALALTLLDGEVSFAVAVNGVEGNGSNGANNINGVNGESLGSGFVPGWSMLEAYIRRHSISQAAPAAEADYVFAAGGMPDAEIRSIMSTLRCGTLLAPEQGATLFLLVEHLKHTDMNSNASKSETAVHWVLQGPGIQDTNRLSISGMNKLWFEERARVNAEYPIGVDIILFTADGDIAALPRTTILREERA